MKDKMKDKMKEIMKDKKNLQLIPVNVIYVVALIAVVFPLLLIGKYNYPSADDWSFGALGYHALKNGEGFFGVIRASFATVKSLYIGWEGRYASSFLASLQPGIWGERCYGVVAWFMIGGIILSELYLCNDLLKTFAKGDGKWLCIPIMVPSLILQLLYSPAPEESFYWYTGAVNYTFVYGLSLILIALFLKLGMEEYKKSAYIWRAAVAGIFAVLVGGNNFSTSLSTCLALLLGSALFLWFDRRAFYRTWFVTALEGIGLVTSIIAPGNMVRLNANFGGTVGGKKAAILMSLQYALNTVCTETRYTRAVLMILLILPFLWKAVRSMNFSFRFPVLFTVVTFGLYASQLTPAMYVERGIYSGRLMAILFYSYHVWLVGNVGYWVGWLSKRTNKIIERFKQICGRLDKYFLVYCVLMMILFAREIGLRGGRSFAAYQSWQKGLPQQYSKEWEERLEVLHDDSVKEVYFAPISVYPAMIMYTDLDVDDGFVVWVNSACAKYYDKDEIHIVAPED